MSDIFRGSYGDDNDNDNDDSNDIKDDYDDDKYYTDFIQYIYCY